MESKFNGLCAKCYLESRNDPNNNKINVIQIQRPLGIYLSSFYVNDNFDDCGKTDPSRKLYDGYFLMDSI